MEQLCKIYPNESILFLKRAIVTTIISGLILTTPIIICIYVSIIRWNSIDNSLRFWSLLRILLFFIQIPLRYDVWRKLNKCYNNIDNNQYLVYILQSKSWKCTQISSFIVLIWVFVTIICTNILNYYYKQENNQNILNYFFCVHGYLSPCLLRWCYISIFIFASHIIFIIYWLRNLMIITNNNEQQNQNHYIIISDQQELSCSICLKKGNIDIQLNQCKHKFHKNCIDQWFKKKLQCPLCLKHYDQSQQKNNKKQQHYDQLLRKRTKYVHFDKAIDVLLQSPATINCNDNNSLLYFLPN